MKKLGFLAAFSMLVALSACTTLKADTFVEDGAAIRGYDTVAYHTERKPVRGRSDFSYEYNGAVWLFSTEQNLAVFRQDPEKYAPQYGGYCAYGMSKGYVVPTDPDAWSVVDGKLYLNFSTGVRKTWLKDVPGNVAKADANWAEKVSSP